MPNGRTGISERSGAAGPAISRRRFLGAVAAMGATLLGVGRAGSAAGRELYADWGWEVSSAPPVELYSLLRYLAVDYAAFEPHEPGYFAALRDLLAWHGIVGPREALDRTGYRDAVGRFQRGGSLPEHGVPDEDTLWELQVGWARSRSLDLVPVQADVWPGRPGQRSFHLRRDAATAYTLLRAAVGDLGGVVTSDGSFRELSAEVSAGRSPTSLHYTGLAFDLATATGMRDPSADPYLVTREGPGWHVWARAEGGAERTLEAVLWSGGRTTAQRVTARVIDFTALANRHGFRDIGHRDCFPGSYTCAEWWHFQYEAALVPYLSQFGIELLSLSLYSEADLRAAGPIWESRKLIRNRGRSGWVSTPGPAR